jgi:hypothetical protein
MSALELTLKDAMEIAGAIAVALVDHESGMTLGSLGGGPALDVELAAAGVTEVVRAERRALHALDLDDGVEDVVVTLGRQYHLIRPLRSTSGRELFLYLVLDRPRADLAAARRRLTGLGDGIIM